MALEWLRPEGFTPEFTASPENHLCPYGYAGDRLWVREAWRRDIDKVNGARLVQYRADDAIVEAPRTYFDLPSPGWVPSIHMHRWASRITLQITGVRVERLQEISEADALAEGITSVRCDTWDRKNFPEWKDLFDAACAAGEKPPLGPSPAAAFHALWAEINGPDSWAANPWVWVVEFKRAA